MKTINKETYSLLENLSKEPFFENHSATLIGGTALAYHYNHRESFDIDICFPHDSNLPPLPFLEKYNLEKNEFDNFVKDTAINEGGDIDTQIQRESKQYKKRSSYRKGKSIWQRERRETKKT